MKKRKYHLCEVVGCRRAMVGVGHGAHRLCRIHVFTDARLKFKKPDEPLPPRELLDASLRLRDELRAAVRVADKRYHALNGEIARREDASVLGKLMTREELKELEALDDLRGAMEHLWVQMDKAFGDLRRAVRSAEKHVR